MDVLMLCYRDEPLREFALRGAALEVGCAPGCDIVVHDPDVAERHLLVQARGGTVYVHQVRGREREWRLMPPNQPVPLGRWHSLVRIPDAPTRPRSITSTTEPLALDSNTATGLSLIVGRGPEARRVALDGHPLSIGSSADNDFMLRDRSVSAHHCRLEPHGGGWRVRDLGSRNGTQVDGVPVVLASVAAGSTIRVGRTDLRLVARDGRPTQGEIVAESPAMREVVAKVERYARNRMPVLIIGESGTGKEGIARALHLSGPRADQPFVAVNAGGMAASLVESELFGHERGAFTGASGVHRGVFEQAHGGTLFLDEIGELPLDMQARLLRVLETGEVRRVGAESTIQVDVRLVCATHRNLARMVAETTMRQDLFFRLAVLMIDIPPLRERPQDIQPLAEHFLARAIEQIGPRAVSEEAVARLVAYRWPGNARELRNVVLRAAAGSAGASISAEDVDQAFRDAGVSCPSVADASSTQLQHVIELHRGNLTAAARALGVPRETLRDRVRPPRRKAG
jgi:transcriptional regulator with AAA-type ATPase domain/pSer/pThr/pTyr-binding forkhead associated (FHA) protein